MGGDFTPLILGDSLEGPRYGQVFSKEASRRWLSADKDHCSYVGKSKQTDVLRQKQMTPAKLIPVYILLVFAREYANGIALDKIQLLRAGEERPGYNVNGEKPSRHLAEEVARAATL